MGDGSSFAALAGQKQGVKNEPLKVVRRKLADVLVVVVVVVLFSFSAVEVKRVVLV